MTLPASGTDASLTAEETAVDWDLSYRDPRFCYSKRDAKAYPYQLARLRMRVHEARYEESLMSGNDESGRRCFQVYPLTTKVVGSVEPSKMTWSNDHFLSLPCLSLNE